MNKRERQRRAAQRERVRAEKDALLLMGPVRAAEYLRRQRAAVCPETDDSPLVLDDYRNKRYSLGGLHERLKQAAKRKADRLEDQTYYDAGITQTKRGG